MGLSVVAMFFIYTTLAKELRSIHNPTLIRSTQDEAEKIQKRGWSNCIKSYHCWDEATQKWGYCDDCDNGYFECQGPGTEWCYIQNGGFSQGGKTICPGCNPPEP